MTPSTRCLPVATWAPATRANPPPPLTKHPVHDLCAGPWGRCVCATGLITHTYSVGKMDGFLLQILNGLDKGSAYAMIALGLTLIFGTLGVVNFAHGALFMIGAFCAVTMQRILGLSFETLDPSRKDFLGNPLKVKTPYVESWFGPELGASIIDWSVPLAILFSIPIMLFVGYAMERGLIKHFYKRPHADQILVTFGLAIVMQEIIKHYYGANPIPTSAPSAFKGSFDFGVMLGFDPNVIIYPTGVWCILPSQLR